jgi:hypothetical protein
MLPLLPVRPASVLRYEQEALGAAHRRVDVGHDARVRIEDTEGGIVGQVPRLRCGLRDEQGAGLHLGRVGLVDVARRLVDGVERSRPAGPFDVVELGRGRPTNAPPEGGVALVRPSWRSVGVLASRSVAKTSLLSAWESWIRVPPPGPGRKRLESGSVSPSGADAGPPAAGLMTAALSFTPKSGVSSAVVPCSSSV